MSGIAAPYLSQRALAKLLLIVMRSTCMCDGGYSLLEHPPVLQWSQWPRCPYNLLRDCRLIRLPVTYNAGYVNEYTDQQVMATSLTAAP